jgi:ubiquitin-protein ligase
LLVLAHGPLPPLDLPLFCAHLFPLRTPQSSNENVAPAVMRNILKEIKELSSTPVEGIRIVPGDEDLTCITAVIVGPEGTPYEGGEFTIRLELGPDFPASPPKGYFITKIFHPNVDDKGSICVNTLKKDWKPEQGMKHVLTVIKCLLIVPNPESALNEEAGKLLLEDYDDYVKRARLMTSIHALPAGADQQQQQQTAPTAGVKRAQGAAAKKKTAAKKKKSARRL